MVAFQTPGLPKYRGYADLVCNPIKLQPGAEIVINTACGPFKGTIVGGEITVSHVVEAKGTISVNYDHPIHPDNPYHRAALADEARRPRPALERWWVLARIPSKRDQASKLWRDAKADLDDVDRMRLLLGWDAVGRGEGPRLLDEAMTLIRGRS